MLTTTEPDPNVMPDVLTPGERQLVAAIPRGCTNREIAEQFAVTERTVKNQSTQVFHKCGVRNRLELALYAMKHRLIWPLRGRGLGTLVPCLRGIGPPHSATS